MSDRVSAGGVAGADGGLRGLHLHIDGAAGAAGDMMLGALLDLGVPREVIEEAFERIGIGRERLRVGRVLKHGLAAVDVSIDGSGVVVAGAAHAHVDAHVHAHEDMDAHAHEDVDAHGDGHGAGHGHDHGRRYVAIVERIRGAGLDGEVARRALDMFERVARAEARLHGTILAEVAFHELGAIDSIADIVGTAAGLAFLAPVAVTAASVAMGHGSVGTAHGVLPVPSPAALEILRAAGGVTSDGGVARELCTPTGAAILAHAVTAWTPMPALVPVAVGHGAGDAELPDRPNVLRLVVGRPLGPGADHVATSSGEDLVVYRVEANVDDMSPEICQHAAEAIFAAGALDVWWSAISMKKSRPALLLGALAPAAALDAVQRAVLTQTTSIGVRFDRVARRVLDRGHATVATRFGPIPVKLAMLDGDVVNAAPEYEACRAAALAHGAPLKDVFAAAVAAWAGSSGSPATG